MLCMLLSMNADEEMPADNVDGYTSYLDADPYAIQFGYSLREY